MSRFKSNKFDIDTVIVVVIVWIVTFLTVFVLALAVVESLEVKRERQIQQEVDWQLSLVEECTSRESLTVNQCIALFNSR